MWIASKYGWFSIVLKEGAYHVRAREEGDLFTLILAVQANFPDFKPEVEEWPEADYRYRIRLDPASDAISDVFASLCCSIDYANFKSAIGVTKHQRHKLPAYHQIWATMQKLQPTK